MYVLCYKVYSELINFTSFTRSYIPALTFDRTDFAESNSSHGRIELRLLLYGFCWKSSRAVHVSLEKLKVNNFLLIVTLKLVFPSVS